MLTCMVLTCDFFYLHGIYNGDRQSVEGDYNLGMHLSKNMISKSYAQPHKPYPSHVNTKNERLAKKRSAPAQHSPNRGVTERTHMPHPDEHSRTSSENHTFNSTDSLYNPLFIGNASYSQWYKESIDGLSCEQDRQPCNSEDECEHLSYLWNMAQLYVSFHSRGIQQIKDGHSDSVRTLTWYCGSTNTCGGLGYRFQGMTVTWLLGMLTGRVILFKWEDESESVVSKYLSPHMVNWRYGDFKLKGSHVDLGNFVQYVRSDSNKNHAAAKIAVYYHNMMKALTGSIPHVQMHFNLLSHLNELIFNLSPSKHFKLPCGHISGIKLPSNGRFYPVLTEFVAIHSLFKLSDKLKSHLYNVQSQIRDITHGAQYVAVHLRTGSFDDLYEPKIQKRTAHKEDWAKAINCAIKQANKHIGSDSIVFLVSDSMEAKHLLSNEYSRVKTFENKIVHVDMHYNVSEDGMLGIWQDIAILAQSNVLVKHVSSFSELAALMCGIPAGKTIDFAKC